MNNPQAFDEEFKRRVKEAGLKKPTLKEPIVVYQMKFTNQLVTETSWLPHLREYFVIAKWKIYLK